MEKKTGMNLKVIPLSIIIVLAAVSVAPIVLIKNDLPVRYYVLFGLSVWGFLISTYNFSRFYKSIPLRASSLTHMGLALMFFGIFASSILGGDHRIRLNKDQPYKIHDMDLTYKRVLKPDVNTSIYQIHGSHNGENEFTANLVFSYSEYNRGVMRHPHIERLPYEDIYFSPVNLTEYPTGVRRTMTKGENFTQDEKNNYLCRFYSLRNERPRKYF